MIAVRRKNSLLVSYHIFKLSSAPSITLTVEKLPRFESAGDNSDESGDGSDFVKRG